MEQKNNNAPAAATDGRQRQHKSRYVALRIEWESLFDLADDATLAALTRGVIKYAKHGTVPEFDGLGAALWGMMRESVDNDRTAETEALKRQENAAFPAKGGRERKRGDYRGDKDRVEGNPILSPGWFGLVSSFCDNYNNQEYNNNTSNNQDKNYNRIKKKNKPIQTTNNQPNLPSSSFALENGASGLAGSTNVSGATWDEWWNSWLENSDKVNLSDYLTELEDYELNRVNGGYGGCMPGAVEAFVTSDEFNREDSIETKKQKLIAYKEKFNKLMDAKQEEFNKPAEIIPSNLPISTQKPSSYTELENFLQEIGHPEFDSESLWEEMKESDWQIRDKKSGDLQPLKSWKNFVRYRVKSSASASTTPTSASQNKNTPIFATPEEKKLYEEYSRGNYICDFEGFKHAKKHKYQ